MRLLRIALVVVSGCGRVGFGVLSDVASGSDASANGDVAADANMYADAIGHWTFDEGSGLVAHDSTGHDNTISLVNSPTWVAGHTGDAVASTGTTEYLTSTVIDLSATPAVTVSIWTNRTYTAGPRHTLFEFSDNFNSYTDGFGLFPDDNTTCMNGQIMIGMDGDVGANFRCFAQPSSGVWHHLVVVYDKSQPGALEAQLYIDGTLQSVLGLPFSADNTNHFGTYPFFFFARGGTQEFNAGELDELAIWGRALSAAEITAL